MNTAFITGHRTFDYPFDYPSLRQGINQLTNLALNRGIKTFLTGMALGTDTLAALIWAERYLTWKAILPCSDQDSKWTYKQQQDYRQLLAKATEIKVLYPKYCQGVMQGRNQYLVDNSQLCLAVWDGKQSGGTYLTIQMARKAKLPLIIFNPKTCEIIIEEPPKQLKLF
ncbi:MAG: SLOG family protein [Planktothrix sp.]|uniref:SLOG family protein n=1 Tax=Planktothrix sp. TaxID=3088171 RepID=UPI0038D379CD